MLFGNVSSLLLIDIRRQLYLSKFLKLTALDSFPESFNFVFPPVRIF